MTGNNANPSQNPANLGVMSGMFREVLNKFLQQTDDMLPARVLSFNRATNRATVQPLIAVLTTDDQVVPRAQIASVPVLQIGAGGFVLNFPLNPGDLGWIKANDRDISLYLQTLKSSAPNTLRKHSFQDAIFIPDPMRGYTIAGEDAGNVVLQNLDGSVKISLGSDKITLTAPDVAIVSTTLTHNGTNIGETHIHSGVDPGGGTSGPPV
jgi:hypothetical protein